MNNAFEPRIIVLSHKDISHLFDNLSGDILHINKDNSPVISISLKFDDSSDLSSDLSHDYQIKFFQPPINNFLGRDIWIALQKFRPNVFFIFLEQLKSFDPYNGPLQTIYNQLLENLDDDLVLAEKKAKEVRVLFFIFYSRRGVVIDQLVQLMLFYNNFRKTFSLSELHEKQIDIDSLNDIKLLEILNWSWDFYK